MILPIITFTEDDLEIFAESFTQEDIVVCLKSRQMSLLHYADVALYKIKDNDYVVIKCIEDDLVNWRIPKEMAHKLLKQFTGRLL
jgi:hypothetical protein